MKKKLILEREYWSGLGREDEASPKKSVRSIIISSTIEQNSVYATDKYIHTYKHRLNI